MVGLDFGDLQGLAPPLAETFPDLLLADWRPSRRGRARARRTAACRSSAAPRRTAVLLHEMHVDRHVTESLPLKKWARSRREYEKPYIIARGCFCPFDDNREHDGISMRLADDEQLSSRRAWRALYNQAPGDSFVVIMNAARSGTNRDNVDKITSPLDQEKGRRALRRRPCLATAGSRVRLRCIRSSYIDFDP
jgi:hypothetical protein